MGTEIQSNCSYIMTNRKGGTVIDLSGADNKCITGYSYNGGDNQKWKLNQIDGGWIIKNVKSDHYLGYEGTGFQSPGDGKKLIATEQPYVWHIWHDEKVPNSYRISVPHTNQDVDLADHGNPSPGTPIHTWGRWEGLNQVWHFRQA